MPGGSETSGPRMHRDRRHGSGQSGLINQPVVPPAPHPALISLVRLLARTAAPEVPAAVSEEKGTTDVEN